MAGDWSHATAPLWIVDCRIPRWITWITWITWPPDGAGMSWPGRLVLRPIWFKTKHRRRYPGRGLFSWRLVLSR